MVISAFPVRNEVHVIAEERGGRGRPPIPSSPSPHPPIPPFLLDTGPSRMGNLSLGFCDSTSYLQAVGLNHVAKSFFKVIIVCINEYYLYPADKPVIQ